MKKYDIHCPHCNGVFLETNGLYREDKPANGSMFEAKQHIKDAGWSVFPLYDSTEYSNLICPSCDGCLVDATGLILRRVEIGEVDEVKEKSKASAKPVDKPKEAPVNPGKEISEKEPEKTIDPEPEEKVFSFEAKKPGRPKGKK